MRDLDPARAALIEAEQAPDEIYRSVWLAMAADHAIADRAVLVGGSAVNIHTQMYRPTDVDMCAYLDGEDREALVNIGFTQRQGDHFEHRFDDGELWLLEFPDARVDGTIMQVRLSDSDELSIITRESLVVDRLAQTTDGSGATFDEAVRLCLAVLATTDWTEVGRQLVERDVREPHIRIRETYAKVMDAVRALDETLGQ